MNNHTEQIYLLNPPGGQSSGLLQRIGENSTTNQVNLENVEDFSTICRTCAAITDQVIPVFSGEGLQNNLADKINKHLSIHISESDALPRAVCVACAHTLLAWHELAACATQADRALRTRLAQLQSGYSQDRKTTNKNSQLEDNNTQNEFEEASSGARTEPPPEYPKRRSARLQACKYCPWHEVADTYKEHLEAEHWDLLFYCDECSSYVDRKDFLLHMGLHMLQHSMNEDVAARPAKHQSSSDNRRESSTNDRTESAPPDTTIQEQPRRSSARNVERKRRSKYENENAESSSTQRAVKAERRSRTVKTEATSVLERPAPEPTTAPTNKLTPRLKAEVISTTSSANVNQNEFSDHSDTEDFGPLPDSVFEAIEDTQDCQPFDTGATPGTETPNQDIDSQSENELPKDKTKKSKKIRACPICFKVYTAASSYFYHLKYSHKEVREHECQVCGRKFTARSCLTQHMSTHSKTCDFECKVCGKKFRSNASLYIHEQSHNGLKTYSCDRCDLSFRWRTHLQRHIKRHAAEKAHVCETCGRGFTIHCDMLRHARTHQAGDYKCVQCGVKFAQLRYLKVHMVKKHTQPINVK